MENNIGSMLHRVTQEAGWAFTGKAKGKGQSIKLQQLKEKNYYFK